MRRTVWRAALLGAVLGAGACASVPVTPAAGEPRYPSYPFPSVPDSLGAPQGVLAWHQAAWQRLQAGDLRGAASAFALILEQTPGFYPAQAGYGFVELARRQFDAAVRRFVVALDPAQEAGLRGRIELLRFRQVRALMAAGQEARRAGRLDEAVRALQQALDLSPTSVVILRDLAIVERERGDLDGALAHARRAVELEPGDAESHAAVGAVLEARGEWAGASEAFGQAAAIESRTDWQARSIELADRGRLAALPPEFAAVPAATTVTRAQVAAAIGVRLEPLVAAAPRRVTAVATDVRGHWAAAWILPVTQAGIMEIFPNHTFQPGGLVSRSDLARIVHALLGLATVDRPADLARWNAADTAFTDLPSSHLVYRAASAAVAARALEARDGRFEPTRPVTGPELLAAIARIDELANR
jgi:tetratricopeptide (TPR) repeat protein